MMNRREKLARIAEQFARRPFHGKTMGLKSNLRPITDHFVGPKKDFEGKWCAAFVYHCCRHAGFNLPPRYPLDRPRSFAGVLTWLQWAKLPANCFYHSRASGFKPSRGDLVIYDRVFDPGPHDHIGIILSRKGQDRIRVAEGNVNNMSCIVERQIDSKIRGYIRIPSDFSYFA